MKTDQQICHEHAAKCIRMAEQFDKQNREKLIQIAHQWIKLAGEAAAGPDNRTIADDHLAHTQIPNPAAAKSKAP
jgi:hypothetical protein